MVFWGGRLQIRAARALGQSWLDPWAEAVKNSRPRRRRSQYRLQTRFGPVHKALKQLLPAARHLHHGADQNQKATRTELSACHNTKWNHKPVSKTVVALYFCRSVLGWRTAETRLLLMSFCSCYAIQGWREAAPHGRGVLLGACQ